MPLSEGPEETEEEVATSERSVLKKLCRYELGTFAHLVSRNAILYSDKDAFIEGTERITYGQFNGRVNSLIHALYIHRRKMEDARNFAMGLTAEAGNRQVLCLPLFHVAAMSYPLGFLYAGGLTVIKPQHTFDPGVTLQTIQDAKTTEMTFC